MNVFYKLHVHLSGSTAMVFGYTVYRGVEFALNMLVLLSKNNLSLKMLKRCVKRYA